MSLYGGQTHLSFISSHGQLTKYLGCERLSYQCGFVATLVCEVISFMWLYIIYRSLLIQVCVIKKKKKNEKMKKRKNGKEEK